MEVKPSENSAKETISGKSIEILFCLLMFRGRKLNFKKKFLILCHICFSVSASYLSESKNIMIQIFTLSLDYSEMFLSEGIKTKH